jgi:hypothetical protein
VEARSEPFVGSLDNCSTTGHVITTLAIFTWHQQQLYLNLQLSTTSQLFYQLCYHYWLCYYTHLLLHLALEAAGPLNICSLNNCSTSCATTADHAIKHFPIFHPVTVVDGFEPLNIGLLNNCSTNCATTEVHVIKPFTIFSPGNSGGWT